ncbi:Ig-like domain repeat protein [Methanosphaera sp. ISO3-F5]|uniref:SpaA isopeptide-forming pilin-related protein n=1 Tax=Methanosphaera sp. ISO3-F5 TaxID=1452353 RepID=UPI002B25F8BC|nr:Ig-like domain repeat protein [Methanosphaera sp. ISO3-F5]WQH63948.1 Ig-like domain repeat protein [Methanosphaera sp. ISO3-F5]
MIKRNKAILCFILVMFITLTGCSLVAATDNADHNTTTTTITKEVTQNAQNNQNNNLQQTQSDDNTIEETDDQNAVKQNKTNAKAKTINKVTNNTKNTKTDISTVTQASNITGNRQGDFILGDDINLGTAKITITGAFTLDGQGHTISRPDGSGTSITTSGSITSPIIIKNVVFKDLAGTNSVYFDGCTDVLIENCTFINCSIGSGIIYLKDGANLRMKNTEFYGVSPILHVYSSATWTGSLSTASLSEIRYNGTEIKTTDFGASSSKRIFTQKAKVVFLYLDVDNIFVNETKTYNINIGEQSATQGGDINKTFEPITGPLSYKLLNSEGNELTHGSDSSANGVLSFDYTFNKKGEYYIHYAYDGLDNYKAINGTKTIKVYETSSMSNVNIASISATDGVTVQVNVKNSTGSTVPSGIVKMTVKNNTYEGTFEGTVENGVATINLPGTLVGGTFNTVINFTGDEENFIAPSSITDTLDLGHEQTDINVVLPSEFKVGEPFTFDAYLTDSSGNGLEGQPLVVKINGETLGGPYTTGSEGNISLTYTPTSNSTITISVEYAGTEDYSGKTVEKVISGSSISLMDPVINFYTTGDASIDEEYVVLVNVTAGDELLDSSDSHIVLDANYIHLEDNQFSQYDSVNKLWTIKFTPSKMVNHTIIFNYHEVVGKINSATKNITVPVEKLPSFIELFYAEDDHSNVTLAVGIRDAEGNLIKDGNLHLNMNNTESERQDYNLSDLNNDLYDYKWNITIDEGRNLYLIYLDPKFFREDGEPYAYVTFSKSDKYQDNGKSISSMDEASKHDTYVKLNTYEDEYNTTIKKVFYLNETVYIHLDIFNLQNFPQNGKYNITITNNNNQESVFYADQTSNNKDGSTQHYLPSILGAGEYTVIVNYYGSGGNRPSSATTTFTVLKLESTTVARIINNTAGNVSIGVKILGQHNEAIRTGKLTVEVDGVPRVISFTKVDANDEVIINLNDLNLGITTTSTVPITITYQGNDRYQSSVALDAATIGEGLTPESLSTITADPGVTVINVTIDPSSTVTIDNKFNVYGYLTEVDGTPITTSNLNITIINPDGSIKSSENITTRGNGFYDKEFTATVGEYEAGEYKVNISYYDENHNIVNVTKTFTIRKISTNMAVTVENTTVGNITLRVKVTDENGNPISEGKINITDHEDNIICNDVELNSNGEATLPLTTITSNIENIFYVVYYNGTSKYASNSYNDMILDYDIITRNITISATPVNDTYGDVQVKVNISDATTGAGIIGAEFNITDSEGNVVGTGTTGADGIISITLTEDLPVGNNTLKVVFPEGNETYSANTLEFTVDIKQRSTDIDVSVANTTAGNVTLKVTLTDPNDLSKIISNGTIIITDNGVVVANHTFTGSADGIVYVKTNITDSEAEHNLEVLFTGNEVYADATFDDTEGVLDFVVAKRNSTITVDPTNNTIGNTTIKVTILDEDGTTGVSDAVVNIYTDDTKTVLIGTGVTGNDGTVDILLNATPGTTGFYVEYPGNTTYDAKNTTETINLEKRLTSVNASLVNSTAGDVSVRVNVTDKTTGTPLTEGTIVIKDKDGNVVAEVPVTGDNPGYVDVKTNITGSGDNKLTVEYKGTDVYDDATFDDTDNVLSFTVDKRNATVDYEVVNSTLNDTVIKVTLLDQDGVTPVTGGTVNVYIDGVENPIGSNTTDENGVTLIKLDVPVDTTQLVINYTGNTTYNENVTTKPISITPRMVNVTASVTNVTAGNVTVRVNVTDIAKDNVVSSGIVNITVNGEVVASINLEDAEFEDDGTVLVTTNVSETGRYKLTVVYDGSPLYGEESYNLEAINVLPKESNITAEVPVKVKGNTSVNVTLVDPVTGEKLNGTVYVSVNGARAVPVEVVNGTGVLPVDMNVGSNTVNVTFNGDEKYNETRYDFTVTVDPRTAVVEAEFTNSTQGNVTLKVTAKDEETGEGINGTVEVTLPNGTKVNVPVVDGEASVVLDIPIDGENPQQVGIKYLEDDTYPEKVLPSESVTVEQRNSSVTAVPGSTSANSTSVIVTVTDPVTGEPISSGTIVVTDNGVEVARVEFNDETGVVEVPTNITTSGPHMLNVTFTGNANYTDANYTDDALSNINIANRTAKIDVTPGNSTFGNTTIDVTVTDSQTGNPLPEGGKVVVYDKDGIEVGNGTIDKNGKVTVPVDVPVDTTELVVKYLGNESSYDPVNVIYTDIKVEPRASNMVATVTNATAGNITVKVNLTDATTGERLTVGTVNITNKGEVVGTVDLSSAVLDEDGLVVISTNITNVGNYALVANYSGNENYTGATFNIESFDSTAKQSNITADIPNTTKDNTTINIKLVDPVTGEGLNGTVYVIVDGQEPGRAVKLVDGVPEDEVKLDLPVGNSTVKVVFDGDKTYNATEHEFNVTVEPRKINVNATLTNTTQGNITLEVNVTDSETGVGVNGTVNVTLPNGTNVTVPVVDGKGVIVLDIPINESSDKPLVVTFPADGVHNETTVNTTNTLTINKRDSKVTAQVTNAVADKAEITVTVVDPVTEQPVTSGNITVYLADEIVGKAELGPDGTVIVKADLPVKSTYNLKVVYEGNTNYTGDSTDLENVEILGSESEFNVTVTNTTQGNVTIKVDLVDPVSGEKLPVDKVNVTLPGEETPKEVQVNPDGTINVPLDVGPNDINISYPGDETYNATSIPVHVDVDTRAMNVVAEVTNMTAGNITVKVNVTDATTGKPVTSGKVNITLGGEVVGEADIKEDGTATIYTNINKTGKYTLVANVGGNTNYTDTYTNIDAFDSTPKESNITAEVPVTVKGNTTVNVTFVDPVTGEKLNGTVLVSVNGSKPVPVQVVDGVGGIPVDLPVGNSTISVTFDGDETYNETGIEFNVTVEPRSIDVGYTITNNTQGNVTIEVTVNDTETGEGINGTAIVFVDGTPVEVEIKDGVGTAVLDIPVTGGEVSVSYPADDTYKEVPATTPETVTVTQRNSSVTARPGNTSANNTSVIVTVTDPVTGEPITSGTIVVTDNGVEVARIVFDDTTGVVEVPTNITTSGPHKLNITYLGNENYTESSYTDEALSNINIANRTANITVTPNNNTVGNTTIDVTLVDSVTGDALPEGGIVEVYDENGQRVGNGTIGSDGKVTVPIEVPIDTKNVTVKYLGNTTSYDPTEKEFTELSLEKRASNITAEVTNTTAGNITVKVNVTDATTGKPVSSGTVNITLNGEVVGTATIPDDLKEDGTVIIHTTLNETGNYKLVAKYSGDENTAGETYTTNAFDATPKESQVTADIPNKTKGNTTIEVELVDPVTGEKLNGTVYVTLPNGTNVPVEVIEGTGKALLDLPVGENTLTVKYPSNNKYDEDVITLPVTVEPRKINVNATLTNTTQGNITLEVNVTDDETGVGVNGTVEVTLPNGTTVPVTIVDGTATVVLDIPITNNTGEPLVVKFPADGVNNETIVNTTNTLSIEKRDSTLTAEVSPKVANKTSVIVEVRDPVTGEPITSGYVNITIGDKLIGRAPVGPDGTVEVMVNIADKGTYDLNVTFEGDENHTSFTRELTGVPIMGSESKLNLTPLNTTKDNVTIKVDLYDPVTNETLLLTTVNVTLPDGTTTELPVSEEGTITVPLSVGEQNITVSYPGSDTFNATSTPLNVTVEPRSTNVDVEVTNNTAGNTTVKVNVTDSETGEPVTSGNVTITVNGEEVGRLPVGPDGTVTIPTSISSTGTYPIVVTYEGNNDSAPVTKQADTITVTPKESQVTAELTNNTRGNTSVNIKLVDPVTGEGLNGTVTVTLPNGTNVPVNVTNGEAVIPVDLPVGNNTLRVTYLGNETYDSIHYEVPVNVQKRETTLTSEVANTTAGSVAFKTSLRDTTTGEPITGGEVVAIVGGKVVGRAPLDKDGNALINTDLGKSGDYEVVLKYEGNPEYETSNTTEKDVHVSPRPSNVTVAVTNNTCGDTKVNITMVDPATNKPVDGKVIVTLPNGKNITATAENGNIILPVDLPVGDNTITVTYPGNDTYDDVVVKVPVKVAKRTTTTSAKQLNNTAGDVAVEVRVNDEATGEPITSGEVTITVNGKQVGKAPVRNGVAIVNTNIDKTGNYKLDVKYNGGTDYESSQTTLTEKVEPRKVDVDVKVVNNTVANTTFEVTVTDSGNGKPVANETVTVTLPNGTRMIVKTDANGRAIIKAGATSGNNQIVVSVDGNDKYNTSSTTLNTTIVKSRVILTVDSVTGTVGEKITLTAHVVNEYGKPVSGGNIVFKLNGRSLQTDGRFDTTTNKPMKLKVVNGLVTFTMNADLYLRAGKNITASYSGSYQYESAKGNIAEANIRKRTASVSLTTSPKLVKQDKDVVFTAKVTDVTTGSTKSMVNDGAYVIFKINGKTLKDSKGESIKVKVTKGVAKYTYHVPLGTSGMIDGHMRDYTVTAVYAADNYYPDARDTNVYNVERSSTKINITSATVKNDQLSIKAKILDQYGKNVIGNNQISIKVNGKTFKMNGKNIITVKDGKINLSGIKLGGNKVKSLTIITGERQSYYESQVTTKSVKTL